jgi:hypothetical protein
MSKLKSHTADIDVTCSALWHRLNAPAAILRLMRSPVLRITAESTGDRSSTFGSRHESPLVRFVVRPPINSVT